jgi:hypothetical protein
MKRREWVVAMLCVAIMVLAACQAKSPTAPSDTRDLSGGSPVTGAHSDYSDDDSYRDDDDDSYRDDDDDDDDDSYRDDDDDHYDDDDDDDGYLRASITANPLTIQPGQSSRLTWYTSGATSVYLNGNSVSLDGSRTVSPSSTKTYYLVARNGWTSVRKSVTITVSTTQPPATVPTATLTAMPASIESGQQTMLTWATTNATSVTMNGNPVALNGSQAYSPTSTTTYTLVASNAAGSATATATVTVTTSTPPPAPMPTASLTASPANIESGQQCTLTWVTTNATSVTMNGTAVALNGSRAYSPTATTTYTLVATNATGSATATSTVTVTAPPPPPPPPPPPMPTASLTASPASIQNGQPTTLTWVTTNATSVTLNGTPVDLNGSHVDFPTATTTYRLVASNVTGSTTATASVTVTAPPPPMPTASFTASPASIMSGESSTLSWTTTDAASVTLNGAPVNATGTQVVSPTATTTYTLVASNATGSVTRSAAVTVVAPPPPPALTYVKDIKPILDSNCIMCHSGPQPTAGYDVSTYSGVMRNVTPYDGSSRLIQVTRPGGQMHGFLNPDPAGRAEIIRSWIVDFGAPQQ